MENIQALHFALVIGAYLLGSISSAIIVCKLMGLPDPRSQGSNNPGATNVLRIGGKKAAAFTLIGDLLKGVIPVASCHLLQMPALIFALTALAAFLGHLYPLYFGLKGGKGVATAIGIQLALSWKIGLVVIAIWLFFAKVVKISSIAALISMTLAPFIIYYVWPAPELIIMQIILTILMFWRHRSNIKQLISGMESKIGS